MKIAKPWLELEKREERRENTTLLDLIKATTGGAFAWWSTERGRGCWGTILVSVGVKVPLLMCREHRRRYTGAEAIIRPSV